jgi:hypothetical protein
MVIKVNRRYRGAGVDSVNRQTPTRNNPVRNQRHTADNTRSAEEVRSRKGRAQQAAVEGMPHVARNGPGSAAMCGV